MITFSHSGGIGDILFSLYFCRDLIHQIKQDKFNFHIQTNVNDPNMSAQSHPFGTFRMTNESANFIKSLLEKQEYINEVLISDNIPDHSINLDLFRTLKINFAAGDIRSWYYNLSKQHLPREFWKPVLYVNKNETYKDKIIITLTERYQNVFINVKELEKFKEHLVFFGMEKEYNIFKENNFEIPYHKCNTLLEIAEHLAGCKGFIGNQSGIYTTAECLKVNRILLSPEFIIYNNRLTPGPVNNHPQGGWNEVAGTTEKMIGSIEGLLK